MSVSKDVTNSCIDFVTLIAAEGYQFRKSFEAGAKKSSLSPMPAFVMTEEHGVNSLSELVDVLKSAAAEGQAVIRGKQLPPEDIRERNEKGKKNISSRPSMGGDERQAVYRRNGHVFEEKPHHWVCMDLDSVKVEGVAFDVNNPEPAIAAAIEQELGDKFYIASYAWCLSSSAGLPEKPGVRVHLWFWMAEPMGRAEWDAWWLWRMHQLGRPVTQAQIAALDVGDFEESSKVRREVESCTDNPYPLGGADKLFNTLSGTINATELLAAKANGTILALDEGNTQAEQQQKGLAQFLYTLASGEGKKRMSQDASGERPGHFWQTFGVFSSEETPQNASERANRGAKMARGVGARILNVHVEKLAGGETFNQALGRDFGHAGPAFVSGLVERGLCESELRRRFDVLRDALTKGASGDVAATAAGTLAILWLAGILAYDFDLIGESSRDAIEVAVKRLWASFCTDQGAASEIETEAAVLDWVARNINNFIPERDRGCRVFGPDGALGWSEPDPEDPGRVIIYLQSGSLAKAAGGTREAQRVARDLRKRGRLLKGDNGRGMKRRVKWADGRPECYALWVEAPDVGESTSPDNQVGMF